MRNKRGKSRKSKLNFLFDHADVDRLDIYFYRQQNFLESIFLLLSFSSHIFLAFFAHILNLNYVFLFRARQLREEEERQKRNGGK